MKTYLILLISVIIIPLLFSFEKNLYFIKNLKNVFKSISVVSIPYLIWDELFTSNKIWGFSDEHLIGLKILNLPVEEILFFFVVPYSLIFLYEVFNYYVHDRSISNKSSIFVFLVIIFSVLAVIYSSKIYTAIQFFLISLFFLSAYYIKWKILSSKNFWIFILFSFGPFFIINYFLTSIPVVWYNENEIIGLRLISIPVEDLFYHFTLTTFYLLVYKYFQSKK